MRINRIGKLAAVAGTCAAVGAGAALVGDAASAPSSSSAAAGQQAAGPGAGKGHRGPLRALRRAVHADAIVPSKDGKFVTVTLDRGLVQSVAGDQLTLKEGTRKATYKTVTLTIPSNAVVRYDRHRAKLSDLKSGQHVMVIQGPKHTAVVARDVKGK